MFFPCPVLVMHVIQISTNSCSLNFYFCSLCTELSQWLIENKLVEHLFGPNLHVEVIL